MKNSEKLQKKGSLLRLLISRALIFISINFLIMILMYLGLMLHVKSSLKLPDIKELIKKVEAATDEELMQLNLEKYIGVNGGIVILDEEGTPIYTNEATLFEDYLPEEVECIREYASNFYVSVTELPEKSSEGNYLVTWGTHSKEGVNRVDKYLFLNKSYEVLSGSSPYKRKYFTKKEFQYLSGYDSKGRSIYRQSFANKNRQRRTAIFMTEEIDEAKYRSTLKIFEHMGWVVVVSNLSIALLCICCLNIRIKKLLTPLNHAIIGFFQGETSSLIDYVGPDEFVEIVDNFVRLKEQLVKSEWERNRLNAGRQVMISGISHDLKTPITVIQGYAMALRSGMVSKEQQQLYLDTIYQKSEHITELLSTLHEYSNLEHPEMPIELSRQNVCLVIQNFFAERYEELEIQGFLLEADILEQPVYANIDIKLLYRVMENLLNNALKYNAMGTTIFVSVSKVGQEAVISFGDNGIGITRQQADIVFEPFVVGDDSRSNQQGSGLGLAIAKKIILLHHGDIKLSINPRQPLKTEFVITIPILV